MSVHLRSISGKVDYDVEQVIRDLVFAVNRLETRPLLEAAPAPDAAPTVEAAEAGTTQRTVVDRQDINDLEEDVGDVTPPPTGTPPPLTHLDLVVALNTVSPGLIDTPDAFTQQIASTLHNGGTIGSVTVVADANWGRFRFSSSPGSGAFDILSNDIVAYRQDNGDLNPFAVTIIQDANILIFTNVPAWDLQGRIGGRWETP